MADYTIEAQARTVIGKQVRQLRNQGLVPAVVYGSLIDPVHIQIPYRPLEVTLMRAGGTHLIDIEVGGQTHTVLTRDVQRHVIRGSILHVDFLAVDVTQVITAEVFIQFTGESPAVSTNQGMLMTGTSSLSIETLPTHIPDHISIDLSSLENLGDAIHVRDLNLGEGVTILNDPEELIARIVQPSAARAAEAEEGEEGAASAVPTIGDEEDED
ncbi:MAG: 50S ribosomal protein L25 [Anaerolineae bacterium]|nr:50S ribosomal protein L25 [Anaerolineae bacterium]